MWIVYAILAALCWGSYATVSRVTMTPERVGMTVTVGPATMMMLGGIVIPFIIFFLVRQPELSLKWKLVWIGLGIVISLVVFLCMKETYQATNQALAFGFLQGILWAGGQIFSFLALSINAPIAALTPIYNMNTLVAIGWGLFFLKEFPSPDTRIIVVIGGILVVLGGIMAGMPGTIKSWFSPQKGA